MGLIYREFTPELNGNIITVDTPSRIFNTVRRNIKPHLLDLKLKPNNARGLGATEFNRFLGRFGFHWLEFLLPEYRPSAEDYPKENELINLGIL